MTIASFFCNAFGGSYIIEADTPGCLRTLQDPADPPLSLSLQSYRVSGSEDPPDPPFPLSLRNSDLVVTDIECWAITYYYYNGTTL